jgi:hypothetical protein
MYPGKASLIYTSGLRRREVPERADPLAVEAEVLGVGLRDHHLDPAALEHAHLPSPAFRS